MNKATAIAADERNLPRRLDLTTLQLFVSVCETGSILRAAEHEFIAASAVSKRLSDLESLLQTPLLYRHARGVEPTPAGQTMLHHARTLLFNLDKMCGELSEYTLGVRGHVRVHANISAIVQFLPEDIAGFLRAHPGVKVALEEHVSTSIINAVQDGHADIGICNPQVNMGSLQSRAYHADRLVLVVPKKHPLAVLPAVRFADTLEYDHVGLHSNSALYLAMRRAAADAGMTIKLRIQVTGLDAMCRMIHNGLGVGVMPHRAYELLQSTGDIAAVPLSDEWATRTLYLVARDFSSLPVTARLLVDHLCAQSHAL
ncbi:LysR substrate-binding domain-containing protein [Variovorax sp. Sphag1AA]|uniref:LysR substrate-binding domain-containing protein n=1 Tax=Variovorax sp. Sphag1AA TaxID=2587027 RepID=UPI00179C078B|nr:LysR substrate-binding domain-containing protein [Variovorax sp. Sphag1AA]MBB3182001.1 DNA-binding transcriptional LysR family regulator [Variovorax sp. Sphag1AA]